MLKKHNDVLKNKLMGMIITPLAFVLAGYLLIYLAFGPTLDSFVGIWNMVTADYKVNEEKDLTTNRLDGYTDSVPSSLITFPTFGDKYAELTIDSADISAPVYYGDGNEQLQKGVAQYIGTMFVGSGSTVMISGHNNTYFRNLGEVQLGDTVVLKTNYGEYTYAVEKTKITHNTDANAYDLAANYENLILYTCYPFNMLGLTPQRYFVYCKYVSGPRILYDR